jgi:GDPmannose 4,6-dehydratase
MSKKTALITGVTGQDGAYLAELLLTGARFTAQRQSLINTDRIDHLYHDPHAGLDLPCIMAISRIHPA